MMLQLGSLSSLQLDTELRMMALLSPLKFWPSDMCIRLSASFQVCAWAVQETEAEC